MKKLISLLLAVVMVLSVLSGFVFAADGKEPAVIASASAATTEAAVIENPAGVKFQQPRKLTAEELITLVQDIAVTYYYQSNEESHIQYDGRTISNYKKLERHADDGRPEDAWYDSTVYSVCSNYPWKVYRNIVGTDYGLFRMRYARSRSWADFPAGTPEVVYQYSGPLAKNSKGETNFEKAYAESRKLVQPGDILAHCNEPNGHALLFVGPIFKEFGDNTDYILHCKGSSFDPTNGRDDREDPAQAIELMKADETVWGGPKAQWSFYKCDQSAVGFAVLRPTLDPGFPQLPTQEAMNRLQFRRLKITRELDRYKYDSAIAGEEIPVILTITNNGAQELKEVPVEEYIPEGTTLVEGSATKTAKVEGSTIKWAVKLPAGKTITLTYKVKVDENAKLGTVLDFKGGLVGGIASRSTILQVGGKGLTAEQNAKIFEHGKELHGYKAFRDLDFVNKFYADALGVNAGLPKTVSGLLRKLTEEKDAFSKRTGKLGLDKMIIPLHFTGMHAVAEDEWEQVREYKEDFYKPGDVFVLLSGASTNSVKKNSDITIMIYLGNEKMLNYTSKGATVDSFENSMWLLNHNLVIGLRPTLAQADISSNTVKTMNFTDVKDSDWYYTNVKKMVETGVINGMTETTFAPNGNLTWGQALKLVALGMGEAEQPAGTHWASGYLALAKEKGWLTKDVDLNANITRKEFCQVAAKADNLTAQPSKNPFADCADKDVLALVEAGVINGMSENTFAPDALLTRAQIAKIMSILVNV